MLNKLWKKGLAIAVISFFIGIGVHPALAVTESYLYHSQGEKDCNCQVDNDLLLIKLNVVLLRLKVYSRILLVLFKYNPDMVEGCEEILDVIKLNRFSRSPFICKFLESLSGPLIKIKDLLMDLIDVFWDYPIIFNVLISYYYRLYEIFDYVNHLYFLFECWW